MRISLIVLLIFISACSTIHFRSNQKVHVSFDGNPEHQKEVVITGKKNFYFWGTEPEHHVVYIDEEVEKAGYKAISKVIVYEQKTPTDILIKFLTFGLYIPTAYTIMGYTFDDAQPVVEPVKK